MNARMDIEFTGGEGTLVRMLGLIERRGFHVRGVGLSGHESGEPASMTVELTPRDAGRRLDILNRQLRRLHGVHAIATFVPPAGAQS